MGGPTVERFRSHFRPGWIRLGDRQGRHPARPVGLLSRDSTRTRLLLPDEAGRTVMACAAPVRVGGVRAERVAHPAVRDERVVRRVAEDHVVAAATPARAAAAGTADRARTPERTRWRVARTSDGADPAHRG